MNIYDIDIIDQKGNTINMSKYKGYTILIVNTAFKCGFAPQYDELVELYNKYKDQNFIILDFPCNQFANQSPGDINQIHEACTLRYDITFPQFNIINVNGQETSPLYKYLKEQTKTKRIIWNFEKFLVDKNGNVIKHYRSIKKPKKIETKIQEII